MLWMEDHLQVLDCKEAAQQIGNSDVDTMLTALKDAKSIVTFGVGREGLVLKAFAMRLHHLGFKVSWICSSQLQSAERSHWALSTASMHLLFDFSLSLGPVPSSSLSSEASRCLNRGMKWRFEINDLPAASDWPCNDNLFNASAPSYGLKFNYMN